MTGGNPRATGRAFLGCIAVPLLICLLFWAYVQIDGLIWRLHVVELIGHPTADASDLWAYCHVERERESIALYRRHFYPQSRLPEPAQLVVLGKRGVPGYWGALLFADSSGQITAVQVGSLDTMAVERDRESSKTKPARQRGVGLE